LARRASFVKEIRNKYENVLLLDAGNTFWSDVPLTRKTGSLIIVEAMNIMGYSAAVLGEKDLTLPKDALGKIISTANFPILSANVLEEDGKPLASPYTILEVKGHRIAILGLTGLPIPPVTGYRVLDPLETGRHYIRNLRKEADIVIVLAHTGGEIAKELGDEEGVDLVVWGGVSGQNPGPFWNESNASLTIIAEVPTPGHAGREVGFARLNLDSKGRITHYEWSTTSLTPSFPDDPAILGLIQRYGGP
jgi:2',3'-cyclic-nucleotide 2'-phosphodiesterase/3'-nucleotidase